MKFIFKVIGSVIGLAMVFALAASVMAWDAFILQNLWAWLAAPIFKVQPLTFFQAAGAMLVVQWFTRKPWKNEAFEIDKTEPLWPQLKPKLVELLNNLIRIPLSFLLFGWVIAQFIS